MKGARKLRPALCSCLFIVLCSSLLLQRALGAVTWKIVQTDLKKTVTEGDTTVTVNVECQGTGAATVTIETYAIANLVADTPCGGGATVVQATAGSTAGCTDCDYVSKSQSLFCIGKSRAFLCLCYQTVLLRLH